MKKISDFGGENLLPKKQPPAKFQVLGPSGLGDPVMNQSPRHDHTDEQHRPCVAWQFKSEQKRAVNNAQKGYRVEEGDFPERPVTRSGSERLLVATAIKRKFRLFTLALSHQLPSKHNARERFT
ncbi:hypothetical protein AVEN_25496-1 [Araneus ventricosus]|uniref:Uncharacterized protein n=1 Tax=Araneus ventricosus TaxID=182803 RepID=A0A4Y2CS01_ARAVE|nr:hypothetical protein AVEN_25496-1 [Araneus ventricosus]